MSVPDPAPNKGLQATANSVRSCLAPALGLSGGRTSYHRPRCPIPSRIPAVSQNRRRPLISSLKWDVLPGNVLHPAHGIIRGLSFCTACSVDVLECPNCSGPMRIVTAINPPEAIRKILIASIPSRAPPIAAASRADDGGLEGSRVISLSEWDWLHQPPSGKGVRRFAARQHLLGVEFRSVRLDTGGS